MAIVLQDPLKNRMDLISWPRCDNAAGQIQMHFEAARRAPVPSLPTPRPALAVIQEVE